MIYGLKRLEVIGGKIYHFEFYKQLDMSKTFLRFQEHYESPRFQGKFFTLNEFKKWYKDIHKSKVFTYYTDWTGYNFPGEIVRSFRDGNFDPLTANERGILEALKNVKGKFYVIGSSCDSGDSTSAVEHELVHALYYLSKKYKTKVGKLIAKESNCLLIKEYLKKCGYSEKSMTDEINAYLSIDPELLLDKGALLKFSPLIKKLQKAYYGERSKVI